MTDPYTQEYNLNTQIALGRDYLLELGYVGTRSASRCGVHGIQPGPTGKSNKPTERGDDEFSGKCDSTFAICRRQSGLSSMRICVQYQLQLTPDKPHETIESRPSVPRQLHLVTKPRPDEWLFGRRSIRDASRYKRPEQLRPGIWSNRFRSHAIEPLSASSTVRRSAAACQLFCGIPLRNWQISGLVVAQSGTPITILDDSAGAVYGNYPFENRAQLSGLAKPATSGSLYSRVVGRYLNPTHSLPLPKRHMRTNPADTDFGNSGEGLVRGPAQRNIDVAVERGFPFAESHSIHVRAEFFNLTNTSNFSNPNSNVSSGPSFGVITSTATNPRIIQLALKYQF